jgi:3-oxoacyl-[acyl-carrier-protein] synthase II
MGAVSMWPDEFHRASRPFNKDRDGFVLGEGAWIFVFEELEHALQRKAKIYGEVAGYGATCDAWHMAKPHPSGEFTARAISSALENACVAPEEVGLFEAYGNSTPVNDSYETGVIKKVFGKHAYNLVVPSIKSMIGHPLGASGAQQVAAVAMVFQEGIVHPTINYEVPDPECDLNYVPNQSSKRKVDVAVCSSIAFGAKNSAVVLSKFNQIDHRK